MAKFGFKVGAQGFEHISGYQLKIVTNLKKIIGGNKHEFNG